MGQVIGLVFADVTAAKAHPVQGDPARFETLVHPGRLVKKVAFWVALLAKAG
jgi:hypothetical protein